MEDTPREAMYCKYCRNCKNWEVEPGNEPCEECLSNPMAFNTEKPVNYDPIA